MFMLILKRELPSRRHRGDGAGGRGGEGALASSGIGIGLGARLNAQRGSVESAAGAKYRQRE